jgi:hypothetical protein
MPMRPLPVEADRTEHSVSRAGDHSLVARRDELHHPPSVGRGIRLRAAARFGFASALTTAGLPRQDAASLSCPSTSGSNWVRSGSWPRAGDATIASLDQSPLAALGAWCPATPWGRWAPSVIQRVALMIGACADPTARAAHQAAAVIRGSIVERERGGPGPRLRGVSRNQGIIPHSNILFMTGPAIWLKNA